MTCIIAPLTTLAKQPCAVNNLYNHHGCPNPLLSSKPVLGAHAFSPGSLPTNYTFYPLQDGFQILLSGIPIMSQDHPTFLLTF